MAASSKDGADATPQGSATADWSEDASDGATSNKEETQAEPEDNLITTTYDVAVKLADMQGDPNSPLYSVKRFEELGL